MYADEAQRWFRNFSINQQGKWRLVVLPHAGGNANFYRELSIFAII